MKKQTNIILLGGTGFIGQYLARHFSSKTEYVVHSFSSKQCDLLDKESTHSVLSPLIKGSHIVMCSAIARLPGEPISIFDRNVLMARNTLDSLHGEPPANFIYLSSTDVYGRPPAALPMREAGPAIPTGNYGLSKLVSEQLLKLNLQCPLACLRLPGIYGPGDRFKSIIGSFVQKFSTGEPVVLDGGGESLRDYYHVKNVADVVEHLITSPQSITLNLATGKAFSLAEVVQHVRNAMGITTSVTTTPPRELQYDFTFDVSKLRETMPELQPIALEDGIKSYVMEALGNSAGSVGPI